MFIILVIILSIISFSLKLGASSLDLAEGVSSRFLKKSDDSENVKNILKGVAKMSLATSKAFMRLSAFIIARVRDLVAFVGSFVLVLDVIVLMIVVVSASTSLVLFTDTDSSGGLVLRDDLYIPNTSEGLLSSSGNSVGISKPKGLSDESWNSADDTGKRVVSLACSVVTNPPNGTPLIYEQGDTPLGYADCSVFICGVLEGALNKTFNGSDAPKGYDFSKNKKSDLTGYEWTEIMHKTVNSKPECVVGYTDTDIDSAKPGDILLTDSHVGMYVGVNDKGDRIMIHSSVLIYPDRYVAYCKNNIFLEGEGVVDVGFSGLTANYKIIRTSKLVE